MRIKTLSKIKTALCDNKGSAIVEATILFPVIIMIFAALVLLSMYLPQRAILQRVTQITTNALSAQRSDDFIGFEVSDTDANSTINDAAKNVYIMLFRAFYSADETHDAVSSVKLLEDKSSLIKSTGRYDNSAQLSANGIKITYSSVNYIIYKEIIVSATREIPMPVNLSFIGFPKTLVITSTSTSIVQNGDEFIRTMDMASDFMNWLDDKYDLSDKLKGVTDAINKITGLLGIKS